MRLRSAADRNGVAVATVLLLILLAWLVVQWTWLFLAPRAAPAAAPAARVADLDTAANRIVNAHLFGVASERKPVEAAPVSTLNLRLKGVFAYSRETPAFAIVNTGAKNDEAFKVGDEITPGVQLDAVLPTHILIDRGGARERVNLEERPGGPGGIGNVGNTGGNTGNIGGVPRSQFRLNVPSPAPNNYNLSRNELQTSLQDPRQLANLGRVNANPGGGVLMEEVPNGSLAERLGLQPGDIIRNVNGNAVNSPNDLTKLYQQLGQAGQIRLEGARGGKPLNLTYNVQQ